MRSVERLEVHHIHAHAQRFIDEALRGRGLRGDSLSVRDRGTGECERDGENDVQYPCHEAVRLPVLGRGLGARALVFEFIENPSPLAIADLLQKSLDILLGHGLGILLVLRLVLRLVIGRL